MRIEAELYDELFARSVEVNDEGVRTGGLWPLTAETVRELTTDLPMQAAGAATLRLALPGSASTRPRSPVRTCRR